MQQLGQPFLLALGLSEDEPIAEDFAGLQASLPYRTLQRFLRDGERLDTIDDARLREQLERALELDAQLAETGELKRCSQDLPAVSSRLAGRRPGTQPGRTQWSQPLCVRGGQAADSGSLRGRRRAFEQLLESYRQDHEGKSPEKLAFSLWSSEAMRHLGILESQILHALGVRPVWDAGGRDAGAGDNPGSRTRPAAHRRRGAGHQCLPRSV